MTRTITRLVAAGLLGLTLTAPAVAAASPTPLVTPTGSLGCCKQ